MRGSIKKRGSTYTYVIDIGPDPLTGKRRQRTKGGFRTRKECLRALNDVIAAARAGTSWSRPSAPWRASLWRSGCQR